jgi:hypothetical protein
MKNLKNYTFFLAIMPMIFLLNFNAYSQQSISDWDLVLIREDHVKPSMTKEYEMALTQLKSFLEEEKVGDFGYFTHLQDNLNFTHVSPINQLSDLDKGMLDYVAQKVNKPELNLILENLNSTIESYRNYIVQYRPELSYVPGTDMWEEGQYYRRWNFYLFLPGAEQDVELILKSWKGLYKNNDIKHGFRVMKGFIGVEQPMYILTTWAEDPLDYQNNIQAIMEKFNQEKAGGLELWLKMMESAKEVETLEGWYLPQYSYTAGLPTNK